MVVDRPGRSGVSARRTHARAGRILVTVTAWTSDELTRLEPIDELGLASRRSDGSLRRFVTIWFVRLDDDLYVRSADGYDNPWFQRALASGDGRIRVGGMERDVTFVAPGPEIADDLNAAYHAKYDGHGARIVGTVVSPEAMRSTLKVVPR